MSHSKRNTSLAFFTAHERSLLRSSWGSQSTRLSRDSFLPFGYCRLCLLPSRDPVACGSGNHKSDAKVHLFCRECVLNDMVHQRKEIKRLEREAGVAEDERADARQRTELEKRQRDLEQFEKGMSDVASSSARDDGSNRLGKRKRDAEEMHGRDTGGHHRVGKERKTKKDANGESSFWVPSVANRDTDADSSSAPVVKQKLKLHPLCPASTPEDKHNYSLKSLVTVRFSEENDNDGPTRKTEKLRICPSCRKGLSNSCRPILGTPQECGHVICGQCNDRFTKDGDAPRCFVCEADLGQRHDDNHNKKQDQKERHKVGISSRGQVEISCEGTGFAGGGHSLTKKEGVAFQC